MEVIDWKISPNKLENPFRVDNKNLIHDSGCASSRTGEQHMTRLLHMACSNGDLELLRQVLKDLPDGNIDVNCIEPHDGASPLHRLSLLVGSDDETISGNIVWNISFHAVKHLINILTFVTLILFCSNG